MTEPLFKKINLLNKIASRLITEENAISIIKEFTEGAKNILEADCGYAWGKTPHSHKHKLIYKSPDAVDEPSLPMLKGEIINNALIKRKNIILDLDVKKENYISNVSDYIKSYVMIPIRYGDHLYGNIVLGYKKRHKFSEEELSLADSIGNNISNLITINWVIENEHKARAMAEKQKEVEILLAQEKLKYEFIADATHEFRTPLAIIRGNVDLALLEGVNNPKMVSKTFKAIAYEIEHLSGLLSDLALVTSGNSESYRMVKNENVDLSKLVRHIAEILQKIAYKQKISIKVKRIPAATIKGDKTYIEKLFRNIIKNAVTYGRENGWIEISGTKKGKFIDINIKDNGIGISAEEIPHIFRRFFKTENSKVNRKGGVGLGLAISKRIAEEHGGDISVKSEPGKGSTFTISLPISK